ncbi:MAG: MBL fold metallo-hydrolase [Ruthenibacterium sp.]
MSAAWGTATPPFVEGRTGVILTDTLDTLERGQKLAELIRRPTGKKVKTILYMHSQSDHRGGAGTFAENEPKVAALRAQKSLGVLLKSNAPVFSN